MTRRQLLALVAPLIMGGCAGSGGNQVQACTQPLSAPPAYVIGAGDALDIFVWRNPELSTQIPVRPDGRISMPLVEDMLAASKTPTQLARDIEAELAEFIRDPTVNVMVMSDGGANLIQIVGSVVSPQSLPYREGMRVLDVVVAAGGLSEFAAGNRARIVRTLNDDTIECRVRLEDLISDGQITENIPILPGDVIIVPESNF